MFENNTFQILSDSEPCFVEFKKEPRDKQDTTELHMHKKMCKMVTKIIKNLQKERNWKCVLPSKSVVRINSNDVSCNLENLGLAPVLNRNLPEMYKNLDHLLYCYRLVLTWLWNIGERYFNLSWMLPLSNESGTPQKKLIPILRTAL